MLFPVSRHERKYRMSIGHRIFVIEEDAIFPISQKTFNELYSGKVGALPKFAGQTVQKLFNIFSRILLSGENYGIRFADISQDIEQRFLQISKRFIGRKRHPFVFNFSPDDFNNIKFRRIRGNINYS